MDGILGNRRKSVLWQEVMARANRAQVKPGPFLREDLQEAVLLYWSRMRFLRKGGLSRRYWQARAQDLPIIDSWGRLLPVNS